MGKTTNWQPQDERQERAATLRGGGMTFAQVGESLGVSAGRAKILAEQWKRGDGHQELRGLSTPVRNALIAAGITTRAGVSEWLIGRDKKVYNIGDKSLAVLHEWAGLSRHSLDTSAKSLDSAIAKLRRHGYTVTPPSEK